MCIRVVNGILGQSTLLNIFVFIDLHKTKALLLHLLLKNRFQFRNVENKRVFSITEPHLVTREEALSVCLLKACLI